MSVEPLREAHPRAPRRWLFVAIPLSMLLGVAVAAAFRWRGAIDAPPAVEVDLAAIEFAAEPALVASRWSVSGEVERLRSGGNFAIH